MKGGDGTRPEWWGLTREEVRLLRALKTPFRVQRFLDAEVNYSKERGAPKCRSPRRVLRDRLARCMDGALFGAAALRVLGYPPLLLDFEAVRDDDHVIAVFRERGGWGAIGKSNFAGLRFREPIYRTPRELAASYFEHYYNLAGEKTLRTYSTRPINLARFDRRHWMTAEDDLWDIAEYLSEVPHSPIATPAMVRALSPMDKRLYDAGLHGYVKE